MKSPKSLNDLISQGKVADNLSVYQQKTSKFRQVHQLLSNLLGDNIAQNILVSNFKNSILYLETTSGAIATGFKMHQSRVLSEVRKEINPATVTIEMKVSPRSTQGQQRLAPEPQPKPQQEAQRHLPKDVADMLTNIAENSDDKLKETLLKLAKHKK